MQVSAVHGERAAHRSAGTEGRIRPTEQVIRLARRSREHVADNRGDAYDRCASLKVVEGEVVGASRLNKADSKRVLPD